MRRILLACPKGGVGKRCLARNLSSASAHEGLSPSMCDLDLQETSHRWGLRRGVRTDPPRVSLIGHDDEVGGPLKAPTWDDLGLLLPNFASYGPLFLDSPPSVEAQPESFRPLLHR